MKRAQLLASLGLSQELLGTADRKYTLRNPNKNFLCNSLPDRYSIKTDLDKGGGKWEQNTPEVTI